MPNEHKQMSWRWCDAHDTTLTVTGSRSNWKLMADFSRFVLQTFWHQHKRGTNYWKTDANPRSRSTKDRDRPTSWQRLLASSFLLSTQCSACEAFLYMSGHLTCALQRRRKYASKENVEPEQNPSHCVFFLWTIQMAHILNSGNN